MKLKRVTALFLAVLMLVFTFPTQTCAAGENETAYDYEIGTAEELLAFAQAVMEGEVSASAVLTADIDVTALETAWTPIGTSGEPYAGIFDGDGHSINLNASLFGTISGNAAVRNLTITGVVSNAGVAQAAQGDSVISYCTSYVTVSSTAGTVGGVVDSASESARIEDCVNDGSVTGLSAGGVVGSASGAVRIENCVNHGPVTGSSTLGVGGIAGSIADAVIVSGCVNDGGVSSTAVGVGGVVGRHGGMGTVLACANLGTVSCDASISSLPNYSNMGVGGVVGYMYGGGTVDSCYNAGTVVQTVQNAVSSYSFYTGGVVGNANLSGCTVSNCYNTGSISTAVSKSRFAASSGSAYAGGVVGILHINAVATGCFNIGGITAESETDTAEAHSIVGIGSGSVSACYYLEGCVEDENAETKSAQEFLTLASDLGDGYKDGAKHPLLTWQEDNAEEEPGPGDGDTRKEVTISVTPTSASFVLTDAQGNMIDAESNPIPGRYIYKLEADRTYYYSASADGYYSVTDAPLEDGTSIAVVLEVDKRIPAAEGVIYGNGNPGQPNMIAAGGIYQIGEGASGVMTIATQERVTLVGTAATLKDLYIDCTTENVNLTLWNVSITDSGGGNLLNVRGGDNYLYFSGTNLLEQIGNISGYALIHVPEGTGLTLGGTTADDILYLYKYEMGAGIGGNGTAEDGGQPPEYNGKITITQGQIFMKGSKQGALIGAGAGAGGVAGTPGDIIINGGFVNLLAVARGAAIGGSAGSTGASTGTNVYMNGGTLTVNVDYSGAAIGGGGYDAGNDRDGGTLYYSGGSIRTYIDKNAVSADDLSDSLWANRGVTQAGVNGNTAITANITNGTVPLYLCVLDTEKLNIEGNRFVIFDGENLIYDGGLHTYCYVNQDKLKTDSNWITISDTTANWVKSEDTCLYLYLTGETHELTINDEVFTAEWDGESFYVHPASAQMLTAPALSGEAEITKDSVILTEPAPSAEEAAAVLEYRVSADGGSIWSAWQESTVFADLKANTAYSFQARYRAMDTSRYSDSMPSAAVMIKTAKDPNAFKSEAEVSGRGVTASVSGTNYADLPDNSGVLTADLVTGVRDITQVETSISYDTLTALAVDWEISAFALETDLGLIRFDGKAITAIAEDMRDTDAVLTMTKTSETEYSVELTVDGKPIFTWAEGGSIYFELPYSRQDDQMSVLVHDGAGNELETEYNPRTERVSFTADRLSDFTIKEVKKGDPYASVWDGLSLDIGWFTPGKSSYSISTPAQLMGLAALVNGIYNDEITTIVGNADYIVDNVANGDSGGNNESTDTYHYGAYDFNGATVYLTADLDMGGSNGCNFMPIGGQYLMAKDDYSTKISSSFCGVFDGDGHTVSNIYCDRYCSGNYGDGSSVGLIGRLGVHDNDPTSLRPSGAAVRNVAVDGYIYANRSVGGIVGKIGKTNGGATIESCANFATVISTDTKGCGGIVGAGWNGGIVRNCYNAGTIRSYYATPTAGISGSNEITLENCYNVGSISSSNSSFAMAIGTNNGGASYSSCVINCWYLEGSASGGGYYSGNQAYNENALTADYMKTVDFATMLGGAFALDTAKINNGYPVLAWQEQAAASVVIKSATTVKNGVATTTVAEEDVSASIKAAEKDKLNTLYIITDTDGKSAGKTVVEIPRTSVQEIAGALLSLSVETADGSRVVMPCKILSAIADRATGKTVELTVTPETADYMRELLSKSDSYENTYLNGSTAISIDISSAGVKMGDFSSDVWIETPVSSADFQANTVYDVLQILSDGTVKEFSGKCVSDGGQLYVTFSTPGLGTFVVLRTAPVIYDDVSQEDWFYEAVMYVTENGLMNGVGNDLFDPDGTMTRAMLVTVLYRLEGSPAVSSAEAFPDVEKGQWYSDAVVWAATHGIVKGYDSGLFGTTDYVTREQIATIVYRYAEFKGCDVSAITVLPLYTDAADISNWASAGMAWANATGLITGRTTTTLVPQGTAERAEVATILMRFCEKVIN